MTFEKEEIRNTIHALTEQQKRMAAALLPMNILEEETERRYGIVTDMLNDISTAIQPYQKDNVNTYEKAMLIVNDIFTLISEGKKRLMEETHGQIAEIEGSNQCSEDGCTDN